MADERGIKIVLLGDAQVGKTAIYNKFIDMDYPDFYLASIGNEGIEKRYNLNYGEITKLIIWDTAGQERFHSIAIKALKSAQGVIIVYDVTKKETFDHVNNWLETIKEEMP